MARPPPMSSASALAAGNARTQIMVLWLRTPLRVAQPDVSATAWREAGTAALAPSPAPPSLRVEESPATASHLRCRRAVVHAGLMLALSTLTGISLALLAAVVVIIAVWWIPKWQARGWNDATVSVEKKAELENSARTTLVQVVGGVALILTFGATLTQIIDTRKATDETLRQTIGQQNALRFTEGVGQLASPTLEVRLAGIYGLEQLAIDTEARRPAIVQLMLAYLRAHHPVGSPDRSEDLAGLRRRAAAPPGTFASPCKSTYVNAWQDTQAALNVVLRFPAVARQRYDLRRTDLIGVVVPRGADLRKADLHNAWLAGAQLQGARLDDAQLYNASLLYACIRDATLPNLRKQFVNDDGAER